MLPATALFVALLVAAHRLDRDAWDKPLSLFRDGPYPAVGYVLFALLLLVGGLHVRLYWRAGRWRETFSPALALVLLVVVVATPSFDALHMVASFLLLGLVFLTYAGKLWAVSSPWLFAHLAAPVGLLMAAAYGAGLTYGVWQKGLILYFLLAVNLDALLATGTLRLPGPDDFRGRSKRRRTATYSPRVLWRRSDGRDRPAGRSST